MLKSPTSTLIKDYAKALAVFTVIDYAWLVHISPSFYRKHISHLLAAQPNLVAAAFFYFIFLMGLVFFAILPAKQNFKAPYAFARGCFFGFVTYSTFDLTCQAVFKDWPTIVTVVDLSWGSLLCGLTTLVCARPPRV